MMLYAVALSLCILSIPYQPSGWPPLNRIQQTCFLRESIAAKLRNVAGIKGGEANPDQKLLAEGIKWAANCAVQNGIKFDVCAEMYKDGADINDAKYNECKCWIPCVAKKMKAMTEDGKWDMEAVKKIVAGLTTPEWKAEAERVLPMCQESTGEGCDVGFNAFVCVMKNSEKSKTYVMKMLNAMAGNH